MQVSDAQTAKKNICGPNLRVGPLANIEPLLRSLGQDPAGVFNAIDLDMNDFQHPDNRIAYTDGAALIAKCVETTRCGYFGLMLGQWFQIWHLGVAGRLALTAPDVGSALRDIIDNLDLHDQGAIATLEIRDRFTTFEYAITISGAIATEQIYDLSITNLCGIMRSLCGSNWNPMEVHLSRAQPEDIRPYQDYFRAPVLFDTLESSLVFANHWLKRPLTTTEPEEHEFLLAAARNLHEAMPQNLTMKVLDRLRRNLPQNTLTSGDVAKQLNLHERTLRRRLQFEGTSFRALLNQVLQSASLHYLAATALPISAIATALGYGSNDAFDHAFRRWYGVSPSRWRASKSMLGPGPLAV